MKKIIEEEILRQLQLINFDRSKTVTENYSNSNPVNIIFESKESKNPIIPSALKNNYGVSPLDTRYDLLNKLNDPKEREQFDEFMKSLEANERAVVAKYPCRGDSNKYPDIDYYDTNCPGRSAFYRLKYQIVGDGTWFSSWGTNTTEVIDALEMLKTEKDYEDLRWWILKETKQPLSVIQWVQGNEYAVGSKYSKMMSKLGGVVGGSNAFSYWANDQTLEEMESILKKFSSDEKAEWEEPEDAFELALPPASREALHVILPLVSLAIMLVPGGQGVAGYLLAFSVEAFDASVYAVVDKDPYAAGLALVFAFAGPLEFGLSKLVKYGSPLIRKLSMGAIGMTNEEFELLMYTQRNGARLAKLTKLGMTINSIRFVIQQLKNMSELFAFISWCIRKGYLTFKFFAKLGIIVTGGFVGWEKINDMFFKYCNSADLKELDKSKTWILKKLAQAAPYLQPYSTPCNQQLIENTIAKTINETDIKSKLKSFLNSVIKNSIVIRKEGVARQTDVAYFQYVLYFMGLDYKAKPIEDVRKDIQKKDGGYNEQQCRDMLQQMLIGGMDMVRLSSHPECDTYFKNDFKTNSLSSKQKKEIDDINKKYPYNPNVKPSEYTYSYGVRVAYKWGTFDEQTEIMLKEFQKRHKLSTIDGTFNPETAKKMLEFLNNGSLSKIEDYGKLTETEEDIELIKQEVMKKLKEIESNTSEETRKTIETMHKGNIEEAKKKAEDAVETAAKALGTDISESEMLTDAELKEIQNYKPQTDTIKIEK